ncbi:MAG TPA: hypothetical protein VK914_05980 [bacterium]|jgi:hypothetical protein|nr:hypothetical protein [bacterium]
MTWVVRDFMRQVAENLNQQGYRVDALSDPRPLGKEGGVWRCDLRSPEAGMPPSVIVKQTGEAWPWRWQDWACQFFLSDLPGTRGLGPEFFAADQEIGYYILEDLGLGSDLGLAIARPDSRGLLAAGLMACSLAGLHAGSFGRARVFSMLRGNLPGHRPMQDEQGPWRRGVDSTLASFPGGLAAGLAQVLDTLSAEMESPLEFLSLTHGDWHATNVWYGDQGPRLLDFRRGSFRHALLDLAAWEWRCGMHVAAAENLWREYKNELARLGADRGERFSEAHARARGWMGLWHLSHGERGPLVRRLLSQAAERPDLAPLAELAGMV